MRKPKTEFWLTDNVTFVKAESVETKQVTRETWNRQVEIKPMLLCSNATVLTCFKNRIMDVEFKPFYGVWLELIK